MEKYLKNNWPWVLPLVGLALFAPFSTYIDLTVSHYYYQGNGHFYNNTFYSWLYTLGFYPAESVAIVSLVILLASLIAPRFIKWRKPALVLILTLGIGSGIITHALLKDHWGRPRPKQVTEFGGNQTFRPFYSPYFTNPVPSKSFTCGHCSIGFYFFALALVGLRLKKHWLFWLGLILAFGLGIALSMARIAQGGHFLSDTIASAIVMWLTAYFCDRIVYKRERT